MDSDTLTLLALGDSAHLAPESGKLTSDQAHRAMRTHRDCQRDQCEMKALAVQTLRDTGEMHHASDYDRR